MIEKGITILFSGTATTAEYLIKNLNKKIEVKNLITNNPKATGIRLADKYKIPIDIIDHNDFEKREDFDKKLVEIINNYNPNLTVLAGFMRILTPYFTKNIKAINLHPAIKKRHDGSTTGILDSWKDQYPNAGSIVHWVTAEVDKGAVLGQTEIIKSNFDNFEDFEAEIKKQEKVLLKNVIEEILIGPLKKHR